MGVLVVVAARHFDEEGERARLLADAVAQVGEEGLASQARARVVDAREVGVGEEFGEE